MLKRTTFQMLIVLCSTWGLVIVPSGAEAADQAFWNVRSWRLNHNCAGHVSAGYINFCGGDPGDQFWEGEFLNASDDRDSHYRSTSGGVSQDKYRDNWVIGFYPWQTNRHRFVSNNFGANIRVCFYQFTNYSTLSFTLNRGQTVWYPQNGTMSMRSC